MLKCGVAQDLNVYAQDLSPPLILHFPSQLSPSYKIYMVASIALVIKYLSLQKYSLSRNVSILIKNMLESWIANESIPS